MTAPLFVRAIRGEKIERPPVWLMRQAGRYLEEYRAIKEKSSFLEMCRTPELAFEVSMQPIRAFSPDAAIVFADILLPAQCLGIDVAFAPGPKVANPIRTAAELTGRKVTSPRSSLPYVFETIRALKSALTKSGEEPKAVIGFAGAPWTMACYLIEQGPYKHFERTAIVAKQSPKELQEFLDHVAAMTEEYLLCQVEAGADVVQLFESWGGILPLDDYRRFALPAVQRIVGNLEKQNVPVILYANGSSHLLPALRESGASCISVDSRTSLATACEAVGAKTAIQGNLDPTDLFLPPSEIAVRTRAMMASFPRRTGYIANLGHGVLQTTPRESVKTFIDTVKSGWS